MTIQDDRTLSKLERDAHRRLRAEFASKPHASRVLARVTQNRVANNHGRIIKPIHFTMQHPARVRIRSAPVKQFSRSAFVKVRYVPNKKIGHWRAHGIYLEREGAQREGGRGLGFDATSDDVKLSSVAGEWQTSGDDKIFKLILSPADGDRLDLPDWTRRVMNRLEQQLGKEIEWVGIDHHNTDQPHVHVLVRSANNLQIPNELMTRGLREIASDETTRDLGYRTPADLAHDREKQIVLTRFTTLDREIQKNAVPDPANPGSLLVTEPRLDRGVDPDHKIEARRQRVERLSKLQTIGVAEKVGGMTWRLDGNWDRALKQLEIMHQRSNMLASHRELLTDPRAIPVVTKLAPGDRLTGRVLGTGLDDGTDSPYILIEGNDGRAHFVSQTVSISNERAEQRLRPGTLVALESKEGKSGKAFLNVTDYGIDIPARGFTKVAIPTAALDADLTNREKTGKPMPSDEQQGVGFAAHYNRELIERLRLLELERNAERSKKADRKKRVRRGPEIDED